MVDSLDPEKLNQLQFSKKLLEKHNRMLGDYQREFDIRNRVYVMKEKRDLLDHWISSAEEGESNGQEKYAREREIVDTNISSLMKELEDINLQYIDNESNSESRKRYAFLEEKINIHQEAIEHWSNKVAEFSKPKTKKSDVKKKAKAKNKQKTKKSESKRKKAKKR